MRSEPSAAVTETKLFAELLQISEITEMLRGAGLGTYYLSVAESKVKMCAFGRVIHCDLLGCFGFIYSH